MELQTDAIGKQYGQTWAVRDVTLELSTGIHGLLGPNGAGKSTLMRLLTRVEDPTTGTVSWNGTDAVEEPSAIRSILGYLPQDFGVYPDLTAREFLEYIAALRGVNSATAADRIDDLFVLTNLEHVEDQKLHSFSGGMRQRVGIAQALVSDPDLLIVDEPTVGLDPEERVRFRNVLSSTASDRIVILSTHIVPDIEATANTVVLLDDGELVTHTTPGELLDATTGSVYEDVVTPDELDALRQEHQVSNTVQRPEGIEVRVVADAPPSPSAKRVTPTLEDAYLHRIDHSGVV
ncbi:ABC-type multidrug transport system, ATPase component [Halobiforma haloterrestris]|uniref:ABC-type multidrug transport system, ATPase component n=1 Tax=Natronobacterium haloterrestre TaxID=148448 RepID=A0A1I1JZN9_NATHA|nr:ABC transporter ATP-binding protein [Halobiforma haloterrestris]SFC51968.1 ABC-type multidrug transport system, ATPase component [Halobiforma haloterrestris]